MMLPGFAIPHKKSTGFVIVDGKRYEYAVLSRLMEPNIIGFVGFPKGQFLFLSKDVPVKFRRHVLAHEVREFAR